MHRLLALGSNLVALSIALGSGGCVGTLDGASPRRALVDAGDPGTPTSAPDARDDDASVPMPPPTAGDAGMPPPVVPIEPDAGPPAAGLAPDLAITRVDLFQTVRVPLVGSDGAPADRDDLPMIAGRDALVRVHAEALSGWRAREITAVLEIESATGEISRFVDRRVPGLPSRVDDPTTGFAIDVPGSAIEPGARFRLRLEDEAGSDDAQRATYPHGGGFAALDAEDVPRLVLVLVPFRFDTDGSGRLPDTSDDYLGRIRDELTSRLPYADVEIRVHAVVPWRRSNRIGGNVDWGAVNAELIELRDAEGTPGSEYWYGLVAADTSRSAYCDRVVGSCVTGQAYVATLRGSRVGSGVGFGDSASVRTIAHELGHMHGRYHAPCGTSGDSGYPYGGGRVGVWGWDRRDGRWHDPAVATDIMGYCSNQWISDYTFRAMHERSEALRASYALVARGAPVVHRFLTIEEDGSARWGEPRTLHALPGEPVRAAWVDAAGRAIGSVDVGALQPAHDAARVYVVPDLAPAGATAIRIDDVGAALP